MSEEQPKDVDTDEQDLNHQTDERAEKTEGKERKKYSFNCLEKECDNRVCCTRPIINVTFDDISRWTTQKVLPHIFHALTFHVPEKDGDQLRIEMAKQPLKKDSEKSACILYNEENNACRIRYSRPISCRTFPLQYTGSKFILSDKTCPGIGKGEVTKESLKEARNIAEQEFKERINTQTALPGVYSVFTTHMLTQSMRAMEGLSEEDKKRLQEILSKGKGQHEKTDKESSE